MPSYPGDANPNFKHGLTDGKSYRHPVYTMWQNMKSRCSNPNNAKFHRYGGRGIKVCEEWQTSSGFADWAFKTGWKSGDSIDRIDNNGDYCPKNCQFISKNLNSRKKSTTKLTIEQAKEIRQRSLNGEADNALAKSFDVSIGTVWFSLNSVTWNEEL